MNNTRRYLALAWIFIIVAFTATAASLPKNSPVPGGIAIIKLAKHNVEPPIVMYRGDRVTIVADKSGKFWQAIVGIPLNANPAKKQVLQVKTPNKKALVYFSLKPKTYPLRRITIKDKSKVTPSAEQAAVIREQSETIENILDQWQDTTNIDANFILPVKGIFSSPFGQRRIFNNVRRARHTGLDIVAPLGTPIKAPADGTVLATGDFIINGNTVFINHGQGLISFYCHLEKIDVEPGEMVKQGEVIGFVGSTGRSTGAHLHWGVSLNGVRVNPLLFVAKKSLAKTQKQNKAKKHQQGADKKRKFSTNQS
ncbi:MAG: peptidoglycan DD-metalloendopeptidase family protein [Pseudomonadota bacterium]